MEGEATSAVVPITEQPVATGYQGVVPRKRIGTQADVQRFQASPTYKLLQTWLHALNKATLRKSNTAPAVLCPAVEGALALLEQVDKLVDETPPETGEMRFGNKAFRTWHAKLAALMVVMVVVVMVVMVVKAAEELHKLVLPEEKAGATQELVAYLLGSFGNAVRIDYGTGHELHFIIWMYCLHALGLVQQEHLAALVTRVFARYLILVRKVQQTYGQEPAGSRGVWCLDDHQFVPFIWGAAQLVDNPDIQPGSIMDKELVARHADEYLYLGCIHYIHTVKKGPFFEHSPDLYNISGATSWEKINKGMFLKYNQDVLSKLPVLQHMLFGSLFPYA